MADSSPTVATEAAKAASMPQPRVPEVQRTAEPEVDSAAGGGQRAVQQVGGGSPQTPPSRYGALLGQMGSVPGKRAGALRGLQRGYGNQYLGRVIQRKADGSGQCSECEKKEEEEKYKVQRKGEGDASSPPSGFNAAVQRSGAGIPLPSSTRGFMESRFGRDFKDVRVHLNSKAAPMIKAQAFTTGRDVYFGSGKFQPETREGKKLIAHELTHVVQQADKIQTSSINTHLENAYEREADQTATEIFENRTKAKKQTSSTLGDRKSLLTSPKSQIKPILQRKDEASSSEGGTSVNHLGHSLTNSRTKVYEVLKKVVTDEGLKGGQAFVETFNFPGSTGGGGGPGTPTQNPQGLGGSRNQGAGGDPNTPAPTPAPGTLLSPYEKEIANLLREEFTRLNQETNAFLSNFETTAYNAINEMLFASEEKLLKQKEKYGLEDAATFSTGGGGGPETYYQQGAGGAGSESNPTRNTASEELAAAAAELLPLRLELNNLQKDQKNLVKRVFYDRKDRRGPDTYISDPARYEQLAERIRSTSLTYNKLQREKVASFPMLAAYTGEGKEGELVEIASGGEKTANKLSTDIEDYITKIEKVRNELGDGSLNIWNVKTIINGTKSVFGATKGTMYGKLVDEKVDSEKDYTPEIISAVSFIVSLALGLLAASTTGGTGAALAFRAGATLVDAAASAYLAHNAWQAYMLADAMTKTDPEKARAVSQTDPSLFWLALDLIGAGLDVFAATKAFQKLVSPMKKAQIARAAGKYDEAAENALRQHNNPPGIGEKLTQKLDEIERPASAPEVSVNQLQQATDALSGHLSSLGLDSGAVARVMAKAPDVNQIKGQLLEEISSKRIREIMSTKAGRATLVGKKFAETAEFIEGGRIRMNGKELTDGIAATLDRSVNPPTVEIHRIFEAKAGAPAKQGLQSTAGTFKNLSSDVLKQAREEAVEELREELPNLVKNGKSLKNMKSQEVIENFPDLVEERAKSFKHAESTGQVQRDIERLHSNLVTEGEGEILETIKIDGISYVVKDFKRSTPFTGIIPSDVKPGRTEAQLTRKLKPENKRLKPGEELNFQLVHEDITEAELRSMAELISQTVQEAPH